VFNFLLGIVSFVSDCGAHCTLNHWVS